MAKEEIATNTLTMSSDIVSFRSSLAAVERQLNNLEKTNTELDSMWDGPANETFKSYFAKNFEKSKRMLQTVNSIVDCIEYARKEYDKCEGEVSSIIASIRV